MLPLCYTFIMVGKHWTEYWSISADKSVNISHTISIYRALTLKYTFSLQTLFLSVVT